MQGCGCVRCLCVCVAVTSHGAIEGMTRASACELFCTGP